MKNRGVGIFILKKQKQKWCIYNKWTEMGEWSIRVEKEWDHIDSINKKIMKWKLIYFQTEIDDSSS